MDTNNNITVQDFFKCILVDIGELSGTKTLGLIAFRVTNHKSSISSTNIIITLQVYPGRLLGQGLDKPIAFHNMANHKSSISSINNIVTLTLTLSDHLKDWTVTSHLVRSICLRTEYSFVSSSFIWSSLAHCSSERG